MKDGQSMYLESRNLSYTTREGYKILDAIDFRVENRSLIGIVGPNGAGKTTLLRLLGGLLEPGTGDVLLDGQSIRSLPIRTYAKMCSYMHQDSVMPFDFTVREVVLMGRHPYLKALSALAKADLAIAQEAMARAGCLADADKRVTHLSGGERQRVMFARLLAQDTPFVLLDEPTASLDINHANQVFKTLKEMALEGKLIMTVMHDLRAAAKYCDQLFLMYKGQLVALGEPEDVLHEGHISYAFDVAAKTFVNPMGNWDFDTK